MQRGQVGQPSPDAVSRTTPPVTTMPMLATKEATAQRRSAASPLTSRSTPVAGRRGGAVTTSIGIPSRRRAVRARTRTSREGTGQSGRAPTAYARRPSPSAAVGSNPTTVCSDARVAVERQHQGAAGQQQHVDHVRQGEGRLGPQPSGQRQSQTAEGDLGQHHHGHREQHAGQPSGSAASRAPARRRRSPRAGRARSCRWPAPCRSADRQRPSGVQASRSSTPYRRS